MADPTSFEANVFPPKTGPNALVEPRSAPLKGDNFAEDIELRADFYVPSMYSLLGFYSNFRAEADSNSSFIPLSQTKANPKLFVVGILPPSVNITGRLLDRSATVANVTGAPVELSDDPVVPIDRTEDNIAVPQKGVAPSGAELPDQFWQDYVLMCDRLQCDPMELAAVLDKESQFDPTAQNFGGKNPREQPVAQGLCQFIRRTAKSDRVGMDDDTWNNFCTLSAQEQLVYVERFYKGQAAGKNRQDLNIVTFGGYNNPDGSIYASREAQAAWIAAHPEDAGKFLNPDRQDAATQQNKRAVRNGIITKQTLAEAGELDKKPRGDIPGRIRAAQEFVQRNGLSSAQNQAVGTPEETSDWKEAGSANASAAKKTLSKTADKDQLRSELSDRFRMAQRAEIAQTVKAVETLRNAPPLRLLVNPSSFKLSSEKIISDGNWTRNGPIVEHWGENQDKLEASGKVAAFFAIDALSPLPDAQGESPGLTRGARQYSASYQNFLSLYMLYRNNANVYTSGTDVGDSKVNFLNRLSLVGSMYIYYDDTLYIGSFDNFNVTETDTAPYTLEYNFQFTVRATFLLDRPPLYSPEASRFLSRRMVLPTTTVPRGNEDFSAVPLPSEAQTPAPPATSFVLTDADLGIT